MLPPAPPQVNPAQVSGFVYQDNNNNGKFDQGDAAIPNAAVTITGTPAGGGAAITQTTLTAADGSYSFSVAPGDYTITQPNITGYNRGADTVGNLGGTSAPGAGPSAWPATTSAPTTTSARCCPCRRRW